MPESPLFLVADLINAEAQSGNASWDELGGPGITMTERPDGSYVLTIPQFDYDDEDEPMPIAGIVITVEADRA